MIIQERIDMDADLSRALSADERRAEGRCRGKRSRPASSSYDRRVEDALNRLRIDLGRRNFGAARSTIAALEEALYECEMDDSTPLVETSLADRPRLIEQLEREFGARYIGDLKAIPRVRLKHTPRIGPTCLTAIQEFLDSLDDESETETDSDP